MLEMYHDGHRSLQRQFDSERLAEGLRQRAEAKSERIGESERAFIEARDMFFLATADAEGRPQCSYKGGDPGFVRVVDDHTVAFPSYDGNGMFLSLGNLVVNPNVGMLFIDFAGRSRLRLNGAAVMSADDPMMAAYPEAQLIVRVTMRELFSNCPRYIHQQQLVERSSFVPRASFQTPIPDWKRTLFTPKTLPQNDPARKL